MTIRKRVKKQDGDNDGEDIPLLGCEKAEAKGAEDWEKDAEKSEKGSPKKQAPKEVQKKDWSKYYSHADGALSNEQLNMICEILDKSSTKKVAYEKASEKNRKSDKYIQTVIGILLALTCGGSIISSFYLLSPEDPYYWGKLVETFLVLVCSVAQVVSLKWNFSLKSAMHHKTSNELNELILETTSELVTGVDNRKGECEDFVNDLVDDYNDICGEALPL